MFLRPAVCLVGLISGPPLRVQVCDATKTPRNRRSRGHRAIETRSIGNNAAIELETKIAQRAFGISTHHANPAIPVAGALRRSLSISARAVFGLPWAATVEPFSSDACNPETGFRTMSSFAPSEGCRYARSELSSLNRACDAMLFAQLGSCCQCEATLLLSVRLQRLSLP